MSSDQQPSASSPIHSQNPTGLSSDNKVESRSSANSNQSNSTKNNGNNDSNSNHFVVRRERPARECTKRAAARLQAAAAAEADAEAAAKERRKKAAARKERLAARLLREEEEEEEEKSNGSEEDEEGVEGEDGSPSSSRQQCGKVVTPLVGEPEPSQLPRWNLRSMWQLASILNFLNVFRPLLNIKAEFSVEEFETALITPNNTLADIHIPLLKAIPPVTRMALGRHTWITVLCRKLRDWWHWVAEGELPIVASHGTEVDAYNTLDPAVRVVILKALCDIRVEQEDIRNYIDESLKQGFQLSLFRKQRIGGDSHGISYWYEDDPVIGHRLYREIRKVEVKKGKGKTVQPIPNSCYQWETVATSLDEFQDVSEKLFSSSNRTEVSVGKKLKNDMLPEVEKVHKKKEKLLKKQHRQALMLDNMIHMDGLLAGRSLRDRKPVTYTFDDYDRSINEAIKVTKKKQPSPEPNLRRESSLRHEASANGRWAGPSEFTQMSFKLHSPKSPENDGIDNYHEAEPLDRGNRQRHKPQRYSAQEFVEAISDNDADFDSDDDIVGEVVYDEEYLRSRKKRRKMSSSSEGDEEYHWDEENVEEEEEEEDEDEDSLSASEESDEPRKFKKLPGRTRRESKLRSVGALQSGLRRSNRATRNRINYKQYELSDSETESMKPETSNASDEHYNATDNDNENENDNADSSSESAESKEDDNNEEMKIDPQVEMPSEEAITKEEAEADTDLPKKPPSPDQDEVEGGQKRHFLDLNELAPGSGFDDAPPNSEVKDNGAADEF
ncbi:PREDICTED: DDT domain-containing protein DDR4-like [Ipomoea nil]|uniref:DDT domain-containing protein DDR4-like n=1 Tax=Ipomoea nil TaxID=35883 RepID=UPI0009013E2C|nr:PREDICTED: DDT domain-containing protein DDR4-like [Ipomoea nil]